MGTREEKLREFCRSAKGLAHITKGQSVVEYLRAAVRGCDYAEVGRAIEPNGGTAAEKAAKREYELDAYRMLIHHHSGIESANPLKKSSSYLEFVMGVLDYINVFDQMEKGEHVSDDTLSGIELLCKELDEFGEFDIWRIKRQGEDKGEKGKFEGDCGCG